MPFALKLNWISGDQTSEPDFVKNASGSLDKITEKLNLSEKKEYGIENRDLKTCLPRIFWEKDLININSNSSPRTNLHRLFALTIAHDIGRVIISEHLLPLYLLADLEDYKEAMRHIVLGIHFLAVSESKILHRDISRNNLMFRRENGKIYGVINDFDLTWMEGRVCKGHKSERTGTRPFMAIGLHLDEIQTHIPDYIERFDLESILYVMYWEARLSNKGEPCATENAKETYKDWMRSKDTLLIDAKLGILHRMNGDYLNESYQPLFYSWLWPLSRIFREAYNQLGESRRDWKSKHRGSLALDDWKLPGFDYDTLNGIVTFEKIWEIMKE